MREYVFLDTSALMQGGQSLVPAYDQMRPGCVVVLSGMVMQELDRQKSGRHAETSPFAREAARQIEDLLSGSKRIGESMWRLGQHSTLQLDLSSWGADAEGDPDAAIIKLAADFADKHKSSGQVVLISRDRIPRIRGMAAGLATLDPHELRARVKAPEPAIVPEMRTRGNGGAKVEAFGGLRAS